MTDDLDVATLQKQVEILKLALEEILDYHQPYDFIYQIAHTALEELK